MYWIFKAKNELCSTFAEAGNAILPAFSLPINQHYMDIKYINFFKKLIKLGPSVCYGLLAQKSFGSLILHPDFLSNLNQARFNVSRLI